MTFFPEVDTKKTIAKAKRKLREYPRWRRIANDIDGQKVTQTYSFDLRDPNGTPSKPVERLAIKKVDAVAELDAIEYAVNNLFDPEHRRIIYEKFLRKEPLYDFEIFNDVLHVSESQYYNMLTSALLAFAEQYRSACLVVERNGVFDK